MTAPDEETAETRDRNHVRSLERGLAVIAALGSQRGSMSLSDVSREAGLDRAAARRFLLTLARLGYVDADGRRFRLTPKVLGLGQAFLASSTLPDLARPHLEKLVREVEESSSVAELVDGEVIYVARVQAAKIMSVPIQVGTRFPAHLTSLGRALLAALPEGERQRQLEASMSIAARPAEDAAALRDELDQAAAKGWALVDQELEPGLRSIAAPIRDGDGRAVAAINISTAVGVATLAEMKKRLLPALLATAAAIEADLSWDR